MLETGCGRPLRQIKAKNPLLSWCLWDGLIGSVFCSLGVEGLKEGCFLDGPSPYLKQGRIFSSEILHMEKILLSKHLGVEWITPPGRVLSTQRPPVGKKKRLLPATCNLEEGGGGKLGGH